MHEWIPQTRCLFPTILSDDYKWFPPKPKTKIFGQDTKIKVKLFWNDSAFGFKIFGKNWF